MELKIKNLYCGYSKKTVLNDVNFSLKTGEAICLLGPNGIGKTTIFKTILGFIPTVSGTIEIDGDNIAKYSVSQTATHIAYVPQAKGYTYQYTVLDMLLMGRSIHIGKFSSPSNKDIYIAETVLKEMDLWKYRNCFYNELSGGEQQIILIARAVVQDTDFILMDEPASNLDFSNESKLLELVNKLKKNGKGVLMTSHTPSHAFLCCEKAILLGIDRTMRFGTVDDVITTKNLTEAYGVPVAVLTETMEDKTLKTCCLY